MKLSIEIHSLRARFDDKTAIKMVKDAGFDAFDMSLYTYGDDKNLLGDDYLEKAYELKEYIDSLGIECNQAHAPFGIRYEDFLAKGTEYTRLVRSIEFASIMGTKNIVIHAIKELPPKVDLKEFNYEFYKSFEPYCERFGICVSVENLFNYDEHTRKFLPVFGDPAEHSAFIESLNSKRFNICLDVGHSAITGFEPAEVIRALNSKQLKALHIHDNNYHEDQHLMPYSGRFDWDAITAALAEVGYNGDFTFEVLGFLDFVDTALLPAALKYAEETGRVLIDKIARKRYNTSEGE